MAYVYTEKCDVSGDLLRLEIDVIKDRFGKRSLMFSAGHSSTTQGDNGLNNFHWLCFSSVNPISIEQMKIGRELTPTQMKYFQEVNVDLLIDPEVFLKPKSLLDKIRNGVKEKFFENLE